MVGHTPDLSPRLKLMSAAVLSAVDAGTAKHLYKKCLQGPLLKNRTVLLVSHAIGLLWRGAEYAVVLDNGKVAGAGEPQKLKEDGLFDAEEMADDGDEEVAHAVPQADGHVAVPEPKDVSIERLEGDDPEQPASQPVKEPEADKFIKGEHAEKGAVGTKIYRTYAGYLGHPVFVIFLVILFLGSQASNIELTGWIRSWSNSVQETQSGSGRLAAFLVETFTDKERDTTMFYLGVYVALNALFGVLVAARTYFLFRGSLRASREMYNRAVRAILGARMVFFWTQPSGTILNRLSNDVQTVDQNLAEIAMLLVQSVLSCVAVLVVVIWATPRECRRRACLTNIF